ncbi:replicative DNA helicase [Spiroplasma turonicum]|uniref:Replicative DNA helicase n=1 Tax=Spiroplasma turonicum TaxID=216946 RepID=A0A0K1P4Q8_9MOLU|nr:replicative DNA helicase [Spiroplasma turonicum]AKU79271.1 replicative DNA helicase [Spiroplasma turonicum]ALX70294.1 replicative DNA helicase [Spiroplasma turonicum]
MIESNKKGSNIALIDAEKTVLAIAMHSPKACFEIMSQLQKEDFFIHEHSLVFNAINDLSTDSKNITLTNLIDKLESSNKLKEVGGIEYLSNILSFFVTDEGFEDYVELVFKNSIGRRLDRELENIKKLRETNTPIEEVFLLTQQRILDIKTDIHKDEATEIKETIIQVIKKIEQLEKNGDLINGVPSGFSELDQMTNGWQNGDFIILAARPSMGKTAFALNLALNAALYNKGVAFFSLEMPKEQLVQRILSAKSKVSSSTLKTAQGITPELWKRIFASGEEIKNMNIIIDDSPGLNVLQLQSKLRKMKRDFNIDICIIDYLQLISSISTRFESRQNEVAAISRQLKKIARELDMPIICLSQLSRRVETREQKVPIMSDLRDSGAIEQDADIIMFLYREAYYDNKDIVYDNSSQTDETDVIISKHRNGPTGTIKINFMRDYGKFQDQIKK